jgi:predicted MFS family arabinose efflux permease
VEILYFVALNGLAHLAFVGCRMTTTLFALELGASPATVGALMSLFALLPMVLSVSAGRLIDRRGPRRPLGNALAALTFACALPFFFPSVWILYVSSTLLGTSFMYVHIAMNSVFGAHGSPEQRAMNFTWLALGFSVSNSIGPLVAGYAIDGLGHARAFLLLGIFPLLALVLLWLRRRPLPRPERAPAGEARRGVFELLRIPPLRHTLLVSAVLAMGWDLYTFLIPLYGASIGLSASTIGAILSTFAVATLAVRTVMPMLVGRIRQWTVITTALAVSGLSYVAFPFVSQVPFLLALSFVLGLGLGAAQPMIMSLLYEASPRGRQGEAVGLRTMMLNGSHTLIPLLSGALSAAVGTGPVFWLLALLLGSGAWFARRQVK